MSNKPTKELFEAVKGFDVNKYKVNGSIIHYSYSTNEIMQTELIDSFYFQAKEWLIRKGLIVNVFNSTSVQGYCVSLDKHKTFIARTEHEALFMACEHKLEKEKQKW